MGSDSSTGSFASRLAQQGGVTLLGKLGGRVFSFLFIIFVTQTVKPGVYGTFTLALAVIAIIRDVFNFNLHQSVDYFLPKALRGDTPVSALEFIEFVIQVVVLGSLLGIVVVVLAKEQVAIFFDTPELAPYLLILALVILFQSIVDIQERIFSTFERMDYRVIVSETGIPFLKFLFVVPLLYLGYEFAGLAYGYLIAIVTAGIVGMYLIWSRMNQLKLSVRRLIRPSSPMTSELFNYAFPLYLTGIVYAASGQISYFVLGFNLGPAEVGVYRVAYQLTANLMLANLAIAPVFKPIISATNDNKTIHSRYQLAARWVLLMTVPIAVTLAVAPEVYIQLLFSSQYVGAAAAVVPLSIGYMLNAVTGPESMLLEGMGHSRVILVNSLVGVGINMLLLFVLVPRFGVLGAGLALGISLALVPAYAATEIYVLESIHPFSRDTIKFLFAGALSGGIGLWLVRSIDSQYLLAVSVPVLILSVYVVVIRVLSGFSSDERRIAERLDEELGYRLFQRIV